MRRFGVLLFAALSCAALLVAFAPCGTSPVSRPVEDHLQGISRQRQDRKAAIITWLDGYYLDQNTMGPVMKLDKRADDLQRLSERFYREPNAAT